MKFVYLADLPEAIPVIAKWYFDQWGRQHEVKSLEESKEMLTDYLNREKIPLMILAKKEKEILGAIQLKYYEMDIYPQKEHWLGGVFVPEQHRGKKIAEKLVLEAAKVAMKLEVKTLFLQTEKLNGGLYKRLGWNLVEKTKYRNKPVLVMRKDL